MDGDRAEPWLKHAVLPRRVPSLRALHPPACGIVVWTTEGPTGCEVMRLLAPHDDDSGSNHGSHDHTETDDCGLDM